jgi:hypothetical protein
MLREFPQHGKVLLEGAVLNPYSLARKVCKDAYTPATAPPITFDVVLSGFMTKPYTTVGG